MSTDNMRNIMTIITYSNRLATLQSIARYLQARRYSRVGIERANVMILLDLVHDRLAEIEEYDYGNTSV